MPACGMKKLKNGDKKAITFRNLCDLKCKNASFKNFGKCEIVKEYEDKFVGSCSVCNELPKMTICGTDGFNYRNECACTCKGTCEKYSLGKCPKEDPKYCYLNCPGLIEP